jgi:hypothetical protein
VAAASSLAGITSDDMRSRIRTNLLAGGVDEDVAMQLRNGTLPDDQDAPGFSVMPTIGPNPRRLRLVPKPPPTPLVPAGATATDEAAVEQRRVAEQRKKLERELEQLEQRAERLAVEADTAEERARSARQAADRADAMRAELADRLKRL